MGHRGPALFGRQLGQQWAADHRVPEQLEQRPRHQPGDGQPVHRQQDVPGSEGVRHPGGPGQDLVALGGGRGGGGTTCTTNTKQN